MNTRSIWRPRPLPRIKKLTLHNAGSFGVGYLRPINSSPSGASTPDHADFAITDLDVLFYAVLDTVNRATAQTFIGQGNPSSGAASASWEVRQTLSSVNLQLVWREAGGTVRTSSPAGTDILDTDGVGKWIRVTLDVDNGAGQWTATFYSSTEPPETDPAALTLTQVAQEIGTTGVSSINNGTANVALGNRAATDQFLGGRIYYAEVLSAIDGTIIAAPDLRWRTDYDSPTQLTDSTGKVWTIASPAWWVLPLQGEEPAAATIVPVGRAITTELGQPVGHARSMPIAQAVSTESGQLVTPARTYALGQAVSTESGQAINPSLAWTVQQAVSTESGQLVTPLRAKAIGQAVTTEQGMAIAASKAKIVAVGQAVSTESGALVTPGRTRAIAQATSTELGQPVNPSRSVTLGQAVTTESAGAVTVQRTRAIGQAVSTELAQAITPPGAIVIPIGQAVSVESATVLRILIPKFILLGQAVSVESGQGVYLVMFHDTPALSRGGLGIGISVAPGQTQPAPSRGFSRSRG